MNITLSIHPKHAENIYSGRKKFEFRRSVPNNLRAGDWVWLYETSPVQLVTGYFVCDGFITCGIDEMISVTWRSAVVQPDELRAYFDGKKLCHAMKIIEAKKIPKPFSPCWKNPPQNFRYGSAWEF